MAKSKLARILIPFVSIFVVESVLAAKTSNPVIANYARPISFEPNRGQTDRHVDFVARGTGYSLFLSHAEAVMVLHGATVRVKPVGANALVSAAALNEQPSKSNYFIGNNPERWHTGIPNYAKVRYTNVYPGVDMIYYGNQRQLEYDFVVKPGADPGGIALEFQGSSRAELDRRGDVVMHTGAGDLRWHKPIAYQEADGTRKLVTCSYVRRGRQRLGFTLGGYERTKPLIIDPVLVYSTYLGGSGFEDNANGIAVDVHGNAYVTGHTTSIDFPTKNAFQSSLIGAALGGAADAFVTKFDAAGNLAHSTYLGGSGIDFGNGIAVDHRGRAYVTGYTESTDFPTKNAFQATLHAIVPSTGNAFVTKFDTDGDALVYSTYLGGSGDQPTIEFVGDSGNAIAVDASENTYVTGVTTSTDFPTKNALQNTSGGEDAFVTKLCPAGNALVYSTHLGGSSLDAGSAIAVDHRGRAYVTGYTESTDFPTKNAFQPIEAGRQSAFVTKLDADGDALVYSTYLGGSLGVDIGPLTKGSGIAVGAHGEAYVTGSTESTDFPTKNAFQNELKGGFDAFVTKFDADGEALVYSTYLGGSSGDETSGIAIDAHGDAYVTGTTSSTDFPTKNAFQNDLSKGIGDAFVTKLDADGDALVYSSYLGGSNQTNFANVGLGIAVGANGSAYVTGFTPSPNFPTKNAFQNTLNGFINAFVTKISAR